LRFRFSSRDAPTLAITTTDLKPSGYPLSLFRHEQTASEVTELGALSFDFRTPIAPGGAE